MITGGYHNGPLSAIRYGGIVGLVFVGTLLILLAVRGVRLINQTRDTPLFISTLFICLPVVFAPAGFVFMAGAYDNALQDSFFAWGLMKILQDVIGSEAPISKLPQEPGELVTTRSLAAPLLVRRAILK